MTFNQNVPVMKSKALRQAIAYAINKDELTQTAFTSLDYAKPATSFLTPDTLYKTDDVEQYKFDLQKAKELLKASGAPDNLKLRGVCEHQQNPESMALYIQQALKGIGVNVELMPLDSNAMSQRSLDMNNTAWELNTGGYIMGSEPDGYKSLFMSNEAYNYAHYKNPQFDALWDKGAVETDAVKRAEIYKHIQQTVANDMTYYPIAYTNATVAVDKRFGGTEEAEPKPVYLFGIYQNLSEISDCPGRQVGDLVRACREHTPHPSAAAAAADAVLYFAGGVFAGQTCARRSGGGVHYAAHGPGRYRTYSPEPGLDKPLVTQYVLWLKNVLQGDLGYSLIYHRPVLEMLGERIPATLGLMGASLLLAIVLAIPLGLLAGAFKHRWLDHVLNLFAYIGISVPIFGSAFCSSPFLPCSLTGSPAWECAPSAWRITRWTCCVTACCRVLPSRSTTSPATCATSAPTPSRSSRPTTCRPSWLTVPRVPAFCSATC